MRRFIRFHIPEHPPAHPRPAVLPHQRNPGQQERLFSARNYTKTCTVCFVFSPVESCYHFRVEVLNILRVENGHERLGADGLAAVLLPDHQGDVLWVVLKVVDERLALSPYGLDDTRTFSQPPPPPPRHLFATSERKFLKTGVKHPTSDEAECWGLGLMPHLLRMVLASRWYSRTSEKRMALLPRTHTVKALLLESGFSIFTTWKDSRAEEGPVVSDARRRSNVHAAFASPHLSHRDDDVTLAAVLASETQVVLRQAYLPERVEVAEGHPQEALVHLQQVFLFGEPEKCPELLALGVSF